MNRISTRRVAAGAAALALLTGGGILAGCGGSDSSSSAATTAAAEAQAQPPNGIEKLSAQEILDKSLAAANAASSVAVVGSQGEGEDGVSFDLVLGADASQGTTSMNGTPLMEFRQIGGDLYWNITREGAEAILGPQAGEAIGGRWVVAPAGSEDADMADLGELGDKDALLASLLTPEGTATVAGTGEVNGTPVVFVDLKDGNDTGTLAIRTTGEPLPVQLRGSEENGDITFSDWNAPVDVTAPEGAVSPDDVLKQGGASS